MAKADWLAIQQGATSDNSLVRKQSLSQAVTELEKAVTACGVNCQKERKKRRSLADMALDLLEKGDQPEHVWKVSVQGGTFGLLLRKAITARNEGVHSDKDVAETECEMFVEIIHTAWHLLRDRFVTRSNASAFAASFLNAGVYDDQHNFLSPIFSDVYLYGSLARQEQPSDIDLLLVDRFGYVAGLSYSVDPVEKAQSILRELDCLRYETKFCTSQNLAAIECGWLDLAVIGHRFGQDRVYTFDTAALQKDPLFFLNIARDMLRYDSVQQNWTGDFGSMPVFQELATLRDRLAEIGIVSDLLSEPRVAQEGLHSITICLKNRTIAKIDQVRKDLAKGQYLSRSTILRWAVENSVQKLSNDQATFGRLLLYSMGDPSPFDDASLGSTEPERTE